MFSGVWGKGGAEWMGRGWKCGLGWWGEGRRRAGIWVLGRLMVCGRVSGIVSVDLGPGSDVKETGVRPGFGLKARGAKSFRPQKFRQKSTNLPTTSPSKETQPSNHFSQLTLQLGRKADFRSMMMNLGCMTLNGRMNMLLICRSRPCNSSGAGRPSLETHVEGGYTCPDGELVWKSFCMRESEERQMRMRILMPSRRARDFAESCRRVSERWERDGERAQKQVTNRISCSASKRAGVVALRICSPVARVKLCAVQDVTSVDGWPFQRSGGPSESMPFASTHRFQ